MTSRLCCVKPSRPSADIVIPIDGTEEMVPKGLLDSENDEAVEER